MFTRKCVFWILLVAPLMAQVRMIPHFTSETGGFETTLILENTRGTSQLYTLRPYDTFGVALNTITGTLLSHETRFLTVAGLTNGSISHVVVDEESDIRVSVSYRVREGMGTPAHVSETTEQSERWRFFAGDWGVVFDGLAVVNVGDRPTDVELRQYDRFGALIQSRTVIEDLLPMAKGLYVVGAPQGSEYELREDTYFELIAPQSLMITALRGTPPDAEIGYLWQTYAYSLDVQAGFEPGEVVWRFQVPEAESSLFPMTLDGEVFVAMEMKGEYDKIYRLNAQSGSMIQDYDFLNRARGFALGADSLFIGGGTSDANHFVRHDLESGAVLWDFAGTPNALGPWSTPIITVSHVFVADPHTLFCLDLETGEAVWQMAAGLAKLAMDSSRLYVGASSPQLLACLDASSGGIIWSFMPSGGISQPPSVDGDRVYYSTYQDNRVHAVSKETGQSLWHFGTGGNVNSSVSLGGSMVYVGSNDQKVYALNAQTGLKVWEFITTGRVRTPSVSDDFVYVNSEGGYLHCLNANTGEAVWSTYVEDLDYQVAPTLSYGAVFVRSISTGELIRIKAQTPDTGDWPTLGHDVRRTGNAGSP